jgi:hypothetical protein
VEAKNGKGDVEVTLPPDASASVNGQTHNGDIVTDYGLAVSGETSKSVTGNIGSGKAKITLSADIGDLRIKKGEGFAALPATPTAPAAPPNAPHLKAPKGAPPQPVTQ